MEKKSALKRLADFGRLPAKERHQYWVDRWRDKGDPVQKVAFITEGILKYIVAPLFLLVVAFFKLVLSTAKKQ